MEDNREAGDTRTRNARVGERSVSWISVVSGVLVALVVALVLGGALGGALTIGGSNEDVPRSEAARLLLTLTVAFLVGGYVAGRMAGRRGLEHGLLVSISFLVAAAALALFGPVVGLDLTGVLGGVTPPGHPDNRQSPGTLISPAGILVLVLPLVGAAFGGIRGAKTNKRSPKARA